VIGNLLQALLAIVLGNVAYFLLAAHLPLPRHQAFQADVGLLMDFFICLEFYALIRKARR
jgi:phosphate starvation-inducible membrane PsiE